MNKTDLEQIDNLLDKRLKPVNRKLDALTADVVRIDEKTKILGDIHENTKDTRAKVEELEERVEILEDKLPLAK